MSVRVLQGHEATIQYIGITPNSRWLVSGSWDKTARLWDLNLDSLIDRARQLAGRELTEQERTQYLVD